MGEDQLICHEMITYVIVQTLLIIHRIEGLIMVDLPGLDKKFFKQRGDTGPYPKLRWDRHPDAAYT